jgi:NAD(P)-dependent dehydrogenase (short-subunit alcohol dehydrogenase family)
MELIMSKAKTNAVIFGVGPRQGLGAELCHRAAARGLHVFVNGRTAEKIGAVAADIVKAGGNATPLLADVTDEAAVNQAVAEIEKDGRPLELAIYNAGNNRPEAFLDVTAEVFEDMWKVICFGGFLVSQAIVPLMLKQIDSTPRQSFLFTGASGSLRGKANFAAFASGKGALRMMVQSLAREFNPQGIHVGHVIIDGAINGEKVRTRFSEYLDSKGEDGALEIAAIADAFFMMHEQHRSAWTQELDLRPFKEEF